MPDLRKQDNANVTGKIFNFRPVTFCALFLATGGLFAYLERMYGLSVYWAFGLLPIVWLLLFLSGTKRYMIGLVAFTAAFLIGFSLFHATVENFISKRIYDGEYSAQGVVVEKSGYNQGYLVTLDGIYIDGKAENGRLVAYLPASIGENVLLADEFSLYGTLKTDVSERDDYGFRADDISGNNVFFIYDVKSGVVSGRAFRPLLWLKQQMQDVLYAGMDDGAAAFCFALLTGDDTGVDGTLLQNVRYGGVAHLFAVSGLHIGVLFAAVLWVFQRKPFERAGKIVRFVSVAVLLFAYGGVCGFTVSVVRAVITCLAGYAYRLVGLKRDGLETLSFSAIVVLLVYPTALCSVGFLLSFSACYGVFLLSRPLTQGLSAVREWGVGVWFRLLRKKPRAVATDVFGGDTPPKSIPQRLWEKTSSFLSVTVAAWLATAPVCLWFFGYLSVWGLLLNCIFVPVLSAFFTLLLAFTLCACLFGVGASAVVLYLPYVFTSAATLAFEVFAFDGAPLTLTFGSVACYYQGLLLCTDKFNVAKRWRFACALVCFLACAVCLFVTG